MSGLVLPEAERWKQIVVTCAEKWLEARVAEAGELTDRDREFSEAIENYKRAVKEGK